MKCASSAVPGAAGGSASLRAPISGLLRIAFAGTPGVEVSDTELRRPPPSYTVDTIIEMEREHPGSDLILLLGFHSHLGSIADWGLDLHGKRQILVDPTTMDTSIPGVYAAGDVAGYEGKITLISIGFGEAAIAANNALARIRGEKVQPKYSTD